MAAIRSPYVGSFSVFLCLLLCWMGSVASAQSLVECLAAADSTDTADFDGDGIIDTCDPDDDNDGVGDEELFPLDNTVTEVDPGKVIKAISTSTSVDGDGNYLFQIDIETSVKQISASAYVRGSQCENDVYVGDQNVAFEFDGFTGRAILNLGQFTPSCTYYINDLRYTVLEFSYMLTGSYFESIDADTSEQIVNPNGDTSPPTIVDLVVGEPLVSSDGQSPIRVPITARFEDNGSGLTSGVYINALLPGRTGLYWNNFSLDEQGVAQGNLELPYNAPNGVYEFEIRVRDQVSNSVIIKSHGLSNQNLPTGFELDHENADDTPPALSELKFNYSYDGTASNVMVTYSVEEASELNYGYVRLGGPEGFGNQDQYISSGDQLDISANFSPGLFYPHYVFFVDKSGLRKQYSYAELIQANTADIQARFRVATDGFGHPAQVKDSDLDGLDDVEDLDDDGDGVYDSGVSFESTGQEMDFFVLQEYAVQQGASIALPATSELNEALTYLVHDEFIRRSELASRQSWLGLLIDSDGELTRSSDGQTVGAEEYTNWAPEEPKSSVVGQAAALDTSPILGEWSANSKNEQLLGVLQRSSASDNCPLIYNPEQVDIDGDGIGDACDDDSDNDGVVDEIDSHPNDPLEWADLDGDGKGDNSDNCVSVSNASQTDSDGDGIGDSCAIDALIQQIEDNALRDCIAGLSIGDYREVKTVSCPNASIERLDGIAAFFAIEYLDLSGNTVTDIGPLSSLSRLRELNLSGTKVTELGLLSGLSLRVLNLSRMNLNSLEGILPDSGSLERLEIHFNQISNLSPISSQPSLERLGMQTNPIEWTTFPPNLVALKDLMANETGLESTSQLPSYIKASIETLDIGVQRTGLSDLSGLSGYFALTNLSVHYNESIDWSTLPELPSLGWLQAYGTGIDHLNELDLVAEQLTYVDVAHNNLENLAGFDSFVNLTGMNAAYNQISDLSHLDRAIGITLGGNQIMDLSPLAIYESASGHRLELWDNPFRVIGDLFMGWTDLTVSFESNENQTTEWLSCQEIAYVDSYLDDSMRVTWPTFADCWDDPDRDYYYAFEDDFPQDPAASKDSDADGAPDEWNEGYTASDSTTSLVLDQAPLDPAVQIDSDNDGVDDKVDAFPLDSTESIDTDGDNIGNNADTDDDGDGLSDADELALGLDPLSADSDADGVPDGQDDSHVLVGGQFPSFTIDVLKPGIEIKQSSLRLVSPNGCMIVPQAIEISGSKARYDIMFTGGTGSGTFRIADDSPYVQNTMGETLYDQSEYEFEVINSDEVEPQFVIESWNLDSYDQNSAEEGGAFTFSVVVSGLVDGLASMYPYSSDTRMASILHLKFDPNDSFYAGYHLYPEGIVSLGDGRYELQIMGDLPEDQSLEAARISLFSICDGALNGFHFEEDTDGDSAIDAFDLYPNDSRYLSDADADSLPNEWEVDYGLDPQDARDAYLDPDQDGYLNWEEFLLGTDPLVSEGLAQVLFTEKPANVSADRLARLTMQYTTTDLNPNLTGLGVRVHYDSSFVDAVTLENVFSTGLIGVNDPQEDIFDFDGDPATDQYLLVSWASFSGASWPGEIPVALFDIVIDGNEAIETLTEYPIRFSVSDTPDGYNLSAESVYNPVVSATLDVDGDGQAKALTDGLLIIRRLFGFSGTSLTVGAVSSNATLTEPADIADRIDAFTAGFDADASGDTKALTDGLLIIRRLFGFSGTSLTVGAVSSDAARQDPDEIAAYIDGLMP